MTSVSNETENRKKLENASVEDFLNTKLSSFDFVAKSIPPIPLVQENIGKITRVRFQNCNLTEIPQGLENYIYISMLDLTENLISDLNPDAFKSFQNLQSLYLSSNRIVDVNINFPPSVTTLDLSYNKNLNFEKVWDINLPSLEVLRLTHCNIENLPDRLPKWSNTIRSLYLDGNLLEDVPEYISTFERLEEISLFGNKLKKFNKNAFKQKFKLINLYFNQIEEWEESEDVSAVTINLNTNLFSSFPYQIFTVNGLRALTLAYCDISGVIDIELPENLAALDLSHNAITSLGSKFISSISRLTALNLTHNKITQIADCFPTQCVLGRLNADHNLLEYLPESFVNATNLDQLTLSNNRLKKLPSISCNHLRILNLSFNQLEELPASISKCSFLTDLNVAFNKLSSIPQSYKSCRKLLDINISGNKFVVFPYCLFTFSHLKTLIASGNKLSTIPDSLGSFMFLQVLDLSNNNFASLPAFLAQLPTLKVLIMAHNHITALPEFACDPQAQYFDLPPLPDAGKKNQKGEKKQPFAFQPSLTHLDLSYNLLTEFTVGAKSLVSLNLDCNLLPTFDFAPYPKVVFVSLNSNRITDLPKVVASAVQSTERIGDLELIGAGPGPEAFMFHILSDAGATVSADRFELGYSATMGVRPSMEDAVTFVRFDERHQLFALFDGHQGNTAAVNAANCLRNELAKVLNASDEELPGLIADAFCEVNRKLRTIGTKDGCTAVAAFVRDEDVYAVGVGDSRMVRVLKEGVERVTVDFKPTMRCEYERLREAGLPVNSDGRIARKLAVARTLGDFWCEGDGLFVRPDVHRFKFGSDDDCLIIACDGVWDVISDAAAGDIVRGMGACSAANVLRTAAFALGSKDNISTIVVRRGSGGLAYANDVEILPVPTEESPCETEEKFPTTARRQRRR